MSPDDEKAVPAATGHGPNDQHPRSIKPENTTVAGTAQGADSRQIAVREKLPNRRRGEAAEFEHNGIIYRASVSRFGDGRLAEIFLDGGKVGTDAHVAGHDAAVAISIALQFGARAETLLHAMEKLADGSMAGPAGAALALFVGDKAVADA